MKIVLTKAELEKIVEDGIHVYGVQKGVKLLNFDFEFPPEKPPRGAEFIFEVVDKD